MVVLFVATSNHLLFFASTIIIILPLQKVKSFLEKNTFFIFLGKKKLQLFLETLAQTLPQHFFQLIQIHRLGNVAVHTRSQRVLHILS